MAKILLVEDDRLLTRLYHKKLTKEGYQVEIAYDGSEGLVKAQNAPPDLVLLDLMMPKMGGLDMLRAFQASPQLQNIPVVVLTNLSAEKEEEEARALGVVDYLVKANNPPDRVLQRIREVLAGTSATAEESPGAEASQETKEKPKKKRKKQ